MAEKKYMSYEGLKTYNDNEHKYINEKLDTVLRFEEYDGTEEAPKDNPISKSITEIKEDLETKITAPENPVVGKILAVKEVLGDGKMVVEWIDAPSGGVSDVTVGGKTIVGEDGVAKLTIASNNTLGLVGVSSTYNVSFVNNNLAPLTWDSFIDKRLNAFMTTAKLDRYVEKSMSAPIAETAGIIDGVYHYPAWTEEEQKNSQIRLGILSSEEVLF